MGGNGGGGVMIVRGEYEVGANTIYMYTQLVPFYTFFDCV